MNQENTDNVPKVLRQLQPIVLLAAVLLVGSNAFILSPILSDVAGALGTDSYRITWAISAFGAATAVSSLMLGSLVDRLPASRVLGGAALLLALAQVLSSLSQHWLWLCLSQAVAGIAVGVLLPGSYVTAAATAPKGREAARLGLVLTGWALALVLAVPLAAFISDWLGWRFVYVLLSGLSLFVGIGLFAALPRSLSTAAVRTPVWRAFRLPGVAPVVAVILMFMSAFYGSFAFFGEGMRAAFDLSTKGAGVFVMAYGLGFGLAGLGLSFAAPQVNRRYLLMVLVAIAASYACWHFALMSPVSAFLGTAIWGGLNQLGLNALVVSLNRRAGTARGAVMGLNGAVTYSAVFAGPMLMGPLYESAGFAGVTGMGAVLVLFAALIAARSL